MPFDDFMAEALYAPGLGYYSGGRRIFGLGPEGGSDFVTAPELSPFFGRALAVQVREALAAVGHRPRLRVRRRHRRAGRADPARRWTPTTPTTTACCACRWTTPSSSCPATCASASRRASRASRRACSGWTPGPRAIEGVVVGNEVLDAMPVKLLHRSGGRWHERGVVDLADPASAARAADRRRRRPPSLRVRRPRRAVRARRRDAGRGRADGRLLRRRQRHRDPHRSPRASSPAWPTACSAASRSWSTTAFPSTSTTTRNAWAAR